MSPNHIWPEYVLQRLPYRVYDAAGSFSQSKRGLRPICRPMQSNQQSRAYMVLQRSLIDF